MSTELNELPIDLHLQIFAKHGLDTNELSAKQSSQMKLEHTNKLTYSLFRAIQFILDEGGLDDVGMDQDLSNLAGIGMSLSEAMSKEVEKLENESAIQTPQQEREN